MFIWCPACLRPCPLSPVIIIVGVRLSPGPPGSQWPPVSRPGLNSEVENWNPEPVRLPAGPAQQRSSDMVCCGSRPTENRVEDSRVSSDCELSGGSRVVSVTIGHQSFVVTAPVNTLGTGASGQASHNNVHRLTVIQKENSKLTKLPSTERFSYYQRKHKHTFDTQLYWVKNPFQLIKLAFYTGTRILRGQKRAL